MPSPRSRDQIQRPALPAPIREPYDRVLIVCEGEKSEPNYFREMVNRHRLSTANVEIVGIGKDPRWIVNRAKELKKQERLLGDQYDAVYCVFDRDQHVHFCSASKSAKSAGLELARSWPCFEHWLVLHFEYRRRPYRRSRRGTAAARCLGELKRHLPGYTKHRAGVYDKLEEQLESAKANAKLAIVDVVKTGEPDPSTEVHLLVAYLQMLATR